MLDTVPSVALCVRDAWNSFLARSSFCRSGNHWKAPSAFGHSTPKFSPGCSPAVTHQSAPAGLGAVTTGILGATEYTLDDTQGMRDTTLFRTPGLHMTQDEKYSTELGGLSSFSNGPILQCTTFSRKPFSTTPVHGDPF